MLSDLPQGPLYSPDDGQPITGAGGYEQKMRHWEAASYEEAVRTRELSPESGRFETYRNYITGHHWSGSEKRARYKSKFYVNKVGKARVDNLALLTDSRPDMEVSSSIEEYEPQGDIIDGVLRAEWTRNDWDLELVGATDIAKTVGTGFWKIGGASPGMMSLNSLGPDCVMPIQPGKHIQQSTGVLYRTWKSLHEVMARFPYRSADLEREAASWTPTSGSMYHRPDMMDPMTWQAMAPQMKRMLGKRVTVDEVAANGFFKTIEWREYWIDDPSINQSPNTILMRDPYIPLDQHNWWYRVKKGERLYPRKRLIIFAGRRLIYDGPAPFWHGLYPFACLRLNPVWWSFWGLSSYRDLIPVNAAINEVVAGVLDMVKKALNPTTIAKNTIPYNTFRDFFPDMPGAKLYLTHMNANPATDVHFADPPQIPNYVMEMLAQFLGPEFDKLAGIVDIANLAKKGQIPGGDTIEQMRDSLQTALRLEGRYIESFLKDAGIQAVSHIFQFYSAKRRMKLLGPDGFSLQDLDFDPGKLTPHSENKYDHWKNFQVNVVPGSTHGGARDRSKQLYMALFNMGAIDQRTLLKKLEIPNAGQIRSQLSEDHQAMAALGMQPGGGASPRMTRGQRNGSPV
jgi:hypothetical protein